MFHPVTVSVPEYKVLKDVPVKSKFLSSLIPGRYETYVYNTEEDYYNEYRRSVFALTHKKGGWDCLRHYEILANGCIPYFPDIDECPPLTMALMPKDLIREGNKLYHQYKDSQDIPIEIYTNHIRKLLDFTRSTLTTEQIARYMLEKSGNSAATKVLFLSGDTGPDCVRCLTLHGFKSILGTNCHDYPKIPHIYKHTDARTFYGKGFTYTNNLESTMRDSSLDATLIDDIANHTYDIVVYGSHMRGMPLLDMVKLHYKPSEILLLNGEDVYNRKDTLQFENSGYHIFVRELKIDD